MGKSKSRGKYKNKFKTIVSGERIKIYSGYKGLASWIDGFELTDYRNAEAIVMPGGGDWNPFWYSDLIGKFTMFNNATDIEHMKKILRAVKDGKFIIGICRGLQGIHIGAGGKLIQHVTNHRSCAHNIIDEYTEEEVSVNSFHHQMVDLNTLSPNDYSLIATASKALSDTYLDGLNQEKMYGDMEYRELDVPEPEAVYYPHINALGFQYHPELLATGSAGLIYTNNVIREIILNKENIAYPDNSKTVSLILSLEEKLDEIESRLSGNEKSRTKSVFGFKKQSTQLQLPTTTISKEDVCCGINTNNEKNWNNLIKEL